MARMSQFSSNPRDLVLQVTAHYMAMAGTIASINAIKPPKEFADKLLGDAHKSADWACHSLLDAIEGVKAHEGKAMDPENRALAIAFFRAHGQDFSITSAVGRRIVALRLFEESATQAA